MKAFGYSVAAVVFVLDQLSKYWVTYVLDLRTLGSVQLLPVFNLTWVENTGVSTGLFRAETDKMRWLLVAATLAIALAVAVWIAREKNRWDVFALGLVLGGALGNIFDRATRGYVIDYADLHFGDFRPFLIFNIADAAITIGVLIILARSLLSREKPGEAAAETAPES